MSRAKKTALTTPANASVAYKPVNRITAEESARQHQRITNATMRAPLPPDDPYRGQVGRPSFVCMFSQRSA